MAKKQDKWYLPDEFKPEYWKGRGVLQIVIGIVIAICGVFYQQNVIFVIAGIVWTIFGVILVALDSKDKQGDEQPSNKIKRNKNDTDIDGENDDELK